MSQSVCLARIFEDAPEPLPELESPRQNRKRRRGFAVVVNDFALAYLFLHKFLMPFFIYYTAAVTPPGGLKLDYWWMMHAALAVLLRRKNWDDEVLRVFCWAVVAGSLYLLLNGLQINSWQTLSLWLTTGASLVAVVVIFKSSRFIFSDSWEAWRMVIPWLVFGCAMAWVNTYLMNVRTLDVGVYDSVVQQKEKVKNVVLADLQNPQCGLSDFKIDLAQINSIAAKNHATISIDHCGFHDQVIRLTSLDQLKVRNHSGHYLSLKFNRLDKINWRPVLNQPLRQAQELILRENFFANDVLLVYSDSHPDIGIQVVLGPKANLNMITGKKNGRLVVSQGIKKILTTDE